jgi:hypothetical protein
MLSWDTDLTPEEQKEYHRLHDKGYRQYQEYGPKTALLHLLMGQDSTTKRFIVIVSYFRAGSFGVIWLNMVVTGLCAVVSAACVCDRDETVHIDA